MSTNVFANGMEVSAKASDNKTIAKMPDVCMSPPPPPAGPIPIPYPNFGQASDTTDGSKTVEIAGKETGLKGKSKYKCSKGDEAATRNFGGSVVSHAITGSVTHQAGSFDVMIEGANACRFGDLMIGNQGSSGMPPGPDTAGTAPPATFDCAELDKRNKEKREELGEEDEKTTISNGTYTPPPGGGPPVSVWAPSNACDAMYEAGGCAGLDRLDTGETRTYTIKSGPQEGTTVTQKVKESEPTGACDEAKERGFEYRSRKSRPHTSHTESRIIEDIFAGDMGTPYAGGSLLLSIDWQHSAPQPDGTQALKSSPYPCSACQRLICAAMICGLEIELCQGKPKQPVKQDKSKCTKADLS
jgi:hypothetical protein